MVNIRKQRKSQEMKESEEEISSEKESLFPQNFFFAKR